MRLDRIAFLGGAALLCACAGCRAERGPSAQSRAGAPAWPQALRPLRPDSLAANGGERDCDLLHVDLEIEILFSERRVEGRVRHTLAALVEGTERLALHSVGLAIERVRDAEGRELAFRLDEPDLEIELAEPLARGARATVEIEYAGEPSAGLYFRETSKAWDGYAPSVWSQGQDEDNRHWIPLWDFPNDRATFEVRATVSEGMSALSNGLLQGVEPPEGDRRTFHWRLDRPIPTYLIALAAGRFERYEDRAGDVPLEYWVGPGTGEEAARRAFGETPAILTWLAETLDEPFPYPRYAQVAVDDFLYAGMENASLTILADYIVGDAASIADLDGDPRFLVAHEIAHQWFGDLVTCLGWSHLWLNEAWASYLELLYQEHAAGSDSMRLWLERYREIYLGRGPETRRPLAESWRTQSSAQRTHHEYDKGPWVLYMLHHALGDELFWQGARAYLDRHADSFVTSADFQRAIFDSTGRNVESLLEQWVEAGGHPVYRVRFDRKQAERGEGPLALEVRQVQPTDELVPLFDMPVAVDLVRADGAVERHVLRVAAERETFQLPLGGPLVDVVFDADCAVLCEIDCDKGRAMWIRQAGDQRNAALRWRALRALAPFAWGYEGQPVRRALAERLSADPEPIVRWLAASMAGYSDLVPDLLEALVRDPSPHVRLAAATSLAGFVHGREAVELLRRAFERETSPAVRGVLSGILGIDAPDAAPPG